MSVTTAKLSVSISQELSVKRQSMSEIPDQTDELLVCRITFDPQDKESRCQRQIKEDPNPVSER
jgi:hypothetical protein